MEKTGRQPRAFHPLLLAAYPALFLFARNTDEATLADLGRALAVLISAACLVWLVARLAVRDRLKAALVVSLTVIAAFSFGYFLESVHGATIGGLLIGKPLGILLLCFIAIKLKLASLPEGVNWLQLTGAGILAGIGFTMSIFITLLAFSDNNIIQYSKIAILLSSLVAGVVGYLLVKKATSFSPVEIEEEK